MILELGEEIWQQRREEDGPRGGGCGLQDVGASELKRCGLQEAEFLELPDK